MWIRLEDGLYLFGRDGINRIEETFTYNERGDKVANGTEFYRDTKRLAVSSFSIDHITDLLEQGHGY